MHKNHIKFLTAICIGALLCSGCQSHEAEQTEDTVQAQIEKSEALVPNRMEPNQVAQNPYLSDAEASIHNDIYNSDVTAQAMPVGIYPEITESIAKDSPNSPPAFFYDNYGNAIVPYSQILENGATLSGGIAIRDVDSPDVDVKGRFQPYLDDNGAKYGIQISYSFVDADNYLIGPATNGHIVMIRTSDENGDTLPIFEKVLDVDVITAAVSALGEDIDQNLLSLVYDYSGNLWFVTGGFHKNPEYSKAGFCGYLEREYIDRCIAGETQLDPTAYLHYMKLGDGENAENGLSAHPEGCIILTNQACYLLEEKEDVVNVRWSAPYESSGGKAAVPETGITGAGLAWGGGSSPTLTNDLVLFTDNLDTVNLIAVDIKTGETVAKTPVLDLGEDVIVSVENSISVYSSDEALTSVLVCNWFGAGNAGLFAADADSSVQSYDNLYDDNWRAEGSSYLMPGVERIDVIKNEDGTYEAKQIWCRDDLKDTSMIKLSTGAGYYYGYTQDEETSQWGFIALDYDTGETVWWMPVSEEPQYNNIAVGIMQGDSGNSIYCPTNSQTLVCLRDRFVYLPDSPDTELDITKLERTILTEAELKEASGKTLTPASELLSAELSEAEQGQTVAFRINGLDGVRSDFHAYYMDADGKLAELENMLLTDETGRDIPQNEELIPEGIYEVRLSGEDISEYYLDADDGNVAVQIILVTE